MERRGYIPHLQESQEQIRSIDFVKFGYDENESSAKDMQNRLHRAGSQRVLQVAKEVFGASVAAYASGAISEQELQNEEGAAIAEFEQGTYNAKEENVVRMLIGMDIAQRLRDTQHSEENIQRLFEQKREFGTIFEVGTVYDRLHNVEDKDLATLHRKLQDGVHKLNQPKQKPDASTKRMQTQEFMKKQKKRG